MPFYHHSFLLAAVALVVVVLVLVLHFMPIYFPLPHTQGSMTKVQIISHLADICWTRTTATPVINKCMSDSRHSGSHIVSHGCAKN